MLAPLVAIAVSAVRPLVDNSMLWHVAAGRLQLEAGEVLRTDPFSFTFAGDPWRTQSWIADIGYATLESWFPGAAWVPWLLTIAGVAFLGLVGLAVYREVPSPTAVGLVLIVLLVITTRFLVPRPVILSLVALAAIVVAVADERSHWVVVPVVWVWAAVHGSWPLGVGVVVLQGVRTGSRRLGAVAIASVVAASLTAHGMAVWEILWRFAVNRDALDVIQEWQRPDFTEVQFLPFLVIVAGIGVAVVQRRVGLRDAAVVLPFLLFGLTSARATLPALVVLAPFAARSLAGLSVEAGTRSRVNAALAAALVALGVLVVATAQTGPAPERFPTEAAAHIEPAATFHSDVAGGYLIYRGERVFVDDRAELYGAEFFRSYQRVRDGGDEWRQVFAEYGIRAALLERDLPLAGVLRNAGWAEIHSDEWFVVLAGPG